MTGSSKVHTTDLLVGKVSLISILSSKISEVSPRIPTLSAVSDVLAPQIQANMYVEPTDAKFKDEPLYQHIQINLQENLFKSLLVSLAASSIRKTIPEKQWGNYLISNQNMECVDCLLCDDLVLTASSVATFVMTSA